MLVIIHFAVVTAGSLTELELADQSIVSQVAKRIIYRSISEIMTTLYQPIHDVSGSRVIISMIDDIIYSFTLCRQIDGFHMDHSLNLILE